MSYSELAYFEGAAFQHIVAWQERQRLTRIRQQAFEAVRRRKA